MVQFRILELKAMLLILDVLELPICRAVNEGLPSRTLARVLYTPPKNKTYDWLSCSGYISG